MTTQEGQMAASPPLADIPLSDRMPFAEQVAGLVGRLSPAEQRVARCLVEQKDLVLLGTAASIAALAETSDATVVRTVRSLGFDGLSDLRQTLLADIIATPSARLRRTLEDAGDDSAQALSHVIDRHEDALTAMKAPSFQTSFSRSIDILFAAQTRHIFGIGPSGALADYASLQFNRIGLRSTALSASGVALADRLLALREGDAIVMIAYAPLYREVEIVIERAAQIGNPIILISDSLGPHVAEAVAEILPVPRGRTDHLAMHGGTMVLIEAMIVGLAGRDRDRAIASLESLSAFRGTIDKAWLKRGVVKK
jgi:DNA-binding MurR/RpiR family transcriptional regulator